MAFAPVVTGPLGNNATGRCSRGPLNIPSITAISSANLPNSTVDAGYAISLLTSSIEVIAIAAAPWVGNIGTLHKAALQSPLYFNGHLDGPVSQGPLFYYAVSEIPESVADSITFVQTIGNYKIVFPNISHSITLVDTLTSELIHNLSSSLTLTQAVSLEHIHLITDTLTLNQSIVVSIIYGFSHSLTLTDEAIEGIEAVSDTLVLTHDVSPYLLPQENLSHSIGVNDSVEEYIGQDIITTFFPIDDIAALNLNYARDITDSITVSHVLGLSIIYGFSHSISLLDEVDASAIKSITQSLSLSHAASESLNHAYEYSVNQVLSLSQTPNRTISEVNTQSIGISHLLSINFDPLCDRTKTYSPIISLDPVYVDGTILHPISQTPKITLLTSRSTHRAEDKVYYKYPYGSPSLILELPAPDMGNREVLVSQKIKTTSRGGTLLEYKADYWPEFRSLEYSFSFLCQEDYDNILEFFEESLGDEIELTDYEGRVWRGLISNPDAAVAQNGRYDYSALIQFQGELVSW